ncbi:helix-turn-helix domain-containing protein [Gracilibacillus alcaliphilus]|uniref:helix-turn-helix domain-containing protein n=1 Tax=Gracilibacillus alcaliphilus TaxID=1401441 RepID=UPI00195A7CAA|nr:AraC family transcriptional regulator [Gracilibacillus alcaliphilus]MBM7679136.1 AraC-like DNA-binding protein [Gracilibacillus alcaliphilus]
MRQYSKHNTYGFRFKGDYQERVAGLHAIGFERRDNPSYRWNGLDRGENDRLVFQYTLNGKGAIRIGETTHEITQGNAFFVQIPSDHCYYLPENSAQWEFIFFTIYGKEAVNLFRQITEKHGHLFQLPSQAGPIRHIFRTLEKVETTGINHGYEASAYAYSFLMECLEYLEYGQQQPKQVPPAITKAIDYMEKHYQEDITLDDIVEVSGVSKYHFTRLFTKAVNDTPIQYLTKIRIQHALSLLAIKEKSIEEIAREVGYTSSNYFSKVFKQMVGSTPSYYRQDTSVMPVDRLFID